MSSLLPLNLSVFKMEDTVTTHLCSRGHYISPHVLSCPTCEAEDKRAAEEAARVAALTPDQRRKYNTEKGVIGFIFAVIIIAFIFG